MAKFQTSLKWSADLKPEDVLTKGPLVDGVQGWKVKFECAAGGGSGTRSFDEAWRRAQINLLSWEDAGSRVFQHERATALKDEAMLRKTTRWPRGRSGFSASIVPGEYSAARAGGRTVTINYKQVDGRPVSRVLFNEDAFTELSGNGDAMLKDHLEQFVKEAREAEPTDVDAYLRQQADADGYVCDYEQQQRREQRQADRDDELDEIKRRLAIDSGWFALTGEHHLPDDHPEAAHLANPACPREWQGKAYDSYLGVISTSPRGSDDDKDLYREALGDEGFRAIILARMPRLKPKKYSGVVDFLVKNAQMDHIWSAAADHPMNMFLEFGPINAHFSDFNNMAGKARHYTDKVMAPSARWMGESIDAEAKIISVE